LTTGVAYREFLLDINQEGASPLLSLDQLQVFIGGAGNLSGYSTATGTLAGQTAVYDLNAGGSHWVALNAALGSGSGSGDVLVAIPDRLFVVPPGNANPYVYVYSAFGANLAANGGFEEWAVRAQTGVSPFGSLSGYVYLDANQNGVYDAGDSGLAGVVVTLTGVNDQGVAVTLTTTTDQYGLYQFDGLRPGTYTLSKGTPDGFIDAASNVGTLGGVAGLDVISAIALGANQNGLNYDFGEIQFTPPA
jgi:hypothetical protein